MKEEVERIKKLVGIDHNRWEQLTSFESGLKSLQRNMGIVILMDHTMMK